MGRVKLKLKTIESETGRITTYSKRKNALLKKTNELAVLCEIDIVLLMFSPTGRLALQIGNSIKFDDIIRRFANTSAEEKARSNMKVFETLKKSYKNSDHEVQAKYFSGRRSRSVEDLSAQSNILQNQLAQTQRRLSDWRNPDKIENVELLEQMEDYLKGLLDQIKSQKNQINGPFSAGELQSPGCKCRNIASTSDQNYDVKSAGAELRFQDDGRHNIASLLIPNFLHESSFGADSHMHFMGNNFQTIASMPYPNFLRSPQGEIRIPGNESQHIDSIPRPIFFLQREPEMGTALTASYLSRLENAVIGSSRDYANNLLQTELISNELGALKREARMNEFAKSDFLINAYNGAEYIKNDVAKDETLGNRFCKTEYLQNNQETFNYDNSRIPFQQKIPFLPQNIVSFQPKFLWPQQNNFLPQQEDIVSLKQQHNMDYSFDEEILAPSSSSHDPVLEWCGSFGALDFAFSDSQQPLTIDDYEAEIFPEPTDQPNIPDLISISKNVAGCI